MTHEINFINGFRAIAAFWVVTAHCVIWGYNGYSYLIPNPKLAVDIFMIVSGFLMALNVNFREAREPLHSPHTWLVFYIRRYFRLAPAYYFSLLMAVLLSEYFLAGYDSLMTINESFWPKNSGYDPKKISYSIENIMAHITFVFGLIPKYAFSTMLPDWSLSLEMQFYFAFPFLYLAMQKWGHLRIGLLASILGWGLVKVINEIIWLTGEGGGFPEPSILPMKIQYFVIGILIYEIGYNKLLAKKDTFLYVALALILSLMEYKRYHYQVMLLPLTVVVMLLLQNNQITWWPIKILRRFFATKYLHIASDSSYAVYLFHGFFISLSGLLLINSSELMALHPFARVSLMWVFVTFFSYLFAYIIFIAIEKPGIKLGKSVVTYFNRYQIKKN